MSRNVEVSRDIAASPEAVFAAISDVTRMGEWSPECHACEWGDGATAPAVGVTFTGHNRHGDAYLLGFSRCHHRHELQCRASLEHDLSVAWLA